MNKISRIVILVNLVVLLVYFNGSIRSKESILSHGKLIYLPLIPIGERTPIQGESLKLFYQITDTLLADSIPKRGFVVVKLDANRVGSLVRVQKNKIRESSDEYLIEYTTMFRDINIGAGSYLIQEDKNDDYGNARYSGLMVDEDGNSVLVGLFDENFNKLDL